MVFYNGDTRLVKPTSLCVQGMKITPLRGHLHWQYTTQHCLRQPGSRGQTTPQVDAQEAGVSA